MSSCVLDSVPEWARSWCYYFAATAFVTMAAGILTMFLSPKQGFVTSVMILMVAVIQAATAMTLFWMCRAAL